MSNFLAIATVTAALQQMLGNAAAVVSGAEVTTLRPSDKPKSPAINIYLYQVAPNPALQNMDLPTRSASGEAVQRPFAALNLNYMISFYGDEVKLEPQRLLGAAVSVLHGKPVLTRQAIQAVISASVGADPNSFMGKSNLVEQLELVRFTPLSLSLDDLSKIWSVFFQAPYGLSVAYQASAVLIETELSPQPALPVARRGVLALPINQPELERVASQAGDSAPILAQGAIRLHGKRLKSAALPGGFTRVAIGSLELTPAPDDISEAQIDLTLPAGLKAGVQAAQVLHQLMLGVPPAPHAGTASNVVAFLLRPVIKKTGPNYQATFTNKVAAPDGSLSGKITVKLTPDLGKEQKAILAINRLSPAPPPGQPAPAYRFEAVKRTTDGDTAEFLISNVQPGSYLVRVQVDAAESPLDIDANPNSPTFGQYTGTPGLVLQ